MITLTIDGQTVEVPAGTTVLQAARQAGVEIPTLCDHPALKPYGGCRLCLVEVEGFRTLVTSCTLPASNGLVVRTDTPAIHSSRKFVLDMIFSERNHFCMFCQKTAGDCELQNSAYAEDMTHWPIQPTWKTFAVDSSHPYFVIDHNRCILCRRCVRACGELVGNHTLSLENRGAQTMLVAGIGQPIAESNCIRCGTCSQVCPTGAIIDRGSAYMAKDAQTERTFSVCTGCSVGCGIELFTSEGRIIRIEGDWNARNKGLLCEQGRYLLRPNGRQRLTTPLVRKDGELQPASWKEAMDAAAPWLAGGKASALASSRLPAEALYAFKDLFAEKLGSRFVAVTDEDIVTPLETGLPQENTFQALVEADLYIVLGADLQESHPVAGFAIRRNLAQGAELILVDVEDNGMAPLTWHNLRLAKGSDAALLDGLMASVSKLGGAQGEAPDGFDPSAVNLSAVAAATALSLESIAKAAGSIAAARKPVIVVGKGMTRPDNRPALNKAVELARLIGASWVSLTGKSNSRAAQAYGLDRPFTSAAGAPLFVALGDDYPTPRLMERLQDVPFLAVQASYASELTERADVVFPVEAWQEQEGHYVNFEGRLQKANRAVTAPEQVLSFVSAFEGMAECMGYTKPAGSWQERLTVTKEL
jgi:formate dehydrogenase major subunit